MPRIKRWFPVSHDINRDPEMWDLCDKFGEKVLRCWLEILSIADRNEGEVPGQLDSISTSVSWAIRCRSTKTRRILDEMMTLNWLHVDEHIKVTNWLKYHKSWEPKKLPNGSLPSEPSEPSYPKKYKNTSSAELKSSTHAVTGFPEDWKWIESMILSQNGNFPKDKFLDFKWWDAVSYTCGGLSPAFLETELAKIKRWVMDNPRREPTPRGYRRFVAAWLERAYERERRFSAERKK